MGTLLAAITGILTTLGNVYAKEWAVKSGVGLFAMTLAFYLAGSVVFPFSLKFGSLTILNTLASVVTILATVLIGLLYYREHITTVQALGLFLGGIALILLSLPMKS